MKRVRVLSGLFLGLFCFAVAIPTAGLAGFSNSDLAGTWHVYSLSDQPLFNDPSWVRGTITINSSGVVTGGSLLNSYNSFATITGGSVSLNGIGVMSGSLTLSGGAPQDIPLN